MRPRWLVVGSVLTAALALVALPGLAGSRTPRALATIPASAFQPLPVSASSTGPDRTFGGLDATFLAAGVVDPGDAFIEPGRTPKAGITRRGSVSTPRVSAGSARKPPRQTLTGIATFYGAGTTAMRLPRGTTVIICGAGGCVERVVTDYGPQLPARIVDLYTPDFFRICGCPSWSGTTQVTVYVY